MRTHLLAVATATFCALSCVLAAETSASREPVRVLVLGTYHFGNPGQDLNNTQADDVLAPTRQAELEALTAVLAQFAPTVVAVERTAAPPYDDPVWPDFDDEMLRTVADERVQIGFRLADAVGIDRVYAVDEQSGEGEPDYFPYDELSSFAKEAGVSDKLAAMSDWSGMMSAFENAQATETIPALLAFFNGEKNRDDFYWNVLAIGEGERQPGPELAAYWFLRNAKIMNKIAQVTEPGDRVVVVYGAGHGHWLREMVTRMDGFELEPVMPYLEQADAAARR